MSNLPPNQGNLSPQIQREPQLTNAQQQQQQHSASNPQGIFSSFSSVNNQQAGQNIFGSLPQSQPILGQGQSPHVNNGQPSNAGLFGIGASNANVAQMQMNLNPNIYQQQYQQPVFHAPPSYGAPIFQPNHPVDVEPNYLFNDDEPLIEKVKQQQKDIKIQLEIKAQRSLVKLKTQTDLPAMATLKSSGGSRTSVDLICVIDNSGSMNGQKIDLVKATLRFLLETLTPADRLSLITFNSGAQRLCGLKCVTGENMQEFQKIVGGIHAGGGTVINSGLQLALKTIRDRKHVNKVTSIFLLSDGQDKGAQQTFKASLALPKNKQLGPFILHSFGFGADHDENLMSKICQLKDGAFYFIKQLATLDEAFCNALGAIISLVAHEVIIKINNISKNIVGDIKIKKVYGAMWQKVNDKQYRVKLQQLMSGITRDFVFELDIPAINTEVGDIERDHNVIEGIFTAKSINHKNLTGECCLELTLLNENENIPETIENVEVVENYLRVKAAEAIEENIKKADKQQFAEAQKGIDNMIQCIQSNKIARKEKMDHLVTDLQQIKQKCSQKEYASDGRKLAMSSGQSHTMQNNFQYSNCIQSSMLSDMRSKKN